MSDLELGTPPPHGGDDGQQSTRRRILDATIALVEERGMTEVSMTAIADRAELSRQTVYNKFANVEAAVCAYLIDQIDNMVEQIDGQLAGMGDPAIQFREFIRMAMHRFAQHEVIVSLQNAMSPDTEEVVRTHLAHAERVLGRIVEEGVETGDFRIHMTNEAVAETVFHMVGGLAPFIAHGADPDETAERVASMLLDGLRA